jgi:hypothetical protein
MQRGFIAQPSTDHPGRYLLANGQQIVVQQAYSGFLYDTTFFDAGAVLAGRADDDVFKNVQNKQLIDCNLEQPHQLNSGQAMEVDAIGIYIPTCFGDQYLASEEEAANLTSINDAQKLLENGYLEVKFNERIICQGPLVFFPTGFGVMNAGLGNVATNVSNASPTNGVAATKLQHDLRSPEFINEKTNIKATLKWLSRGWTDAVATTAVVQPTLIGTASCKVVLQGTRFYGLG